MEVVIRTGWHWEFGWLRRPEADETYGFCYEEPDGDLVYFQDRRAKYRVLLDVREDPESGERYLCVSDKPPLSTNKRVKVRK